MGKKRESTESRRISDDAVQAKTGRTWPEWFKILDKAGAKKMEHKHIAAYLQGKHGLPGWWAQTVTVGYEQARGMRELHQKPDGYAVSSSKTIGVPVGRVYTAWRDKRARGRWLGNEAIEIRKATPDKSMRITWTDGKTHVDVNFYSKGETKSQVAVQHRKLKDAKQAARMKVYWGERLFRLKELLEK